MEAAKRNICIAVHEKVFFYFFYLKSNLGKNYSPKKLNATPNFCSKRRRGGRGRRGYQASKGILTEIDWTKYL